MIAANKFRILLYGVFALICAFGGGKSFTASSARGGLLDSYFFLSPKISKVGNYEKADHNTAVALWVLHGKRLPSLSLDEAYQLAYEDHSYDEGKYLVNKKHLCLANDHTCEEVYLYKKALDERNYRELFRIYVDRYLFWCRDYISICESSNKSAGQGNSTMKPNSGGAPYNARAVNVEQPFSYLPFGVYHFDRLKRGEQIYHRDNSNPFHVIGLFTIRSKGKDFKNYTSVQDWNNKRMVIRINEDVEDVDIIFAKTSYGHGFPYLYPYGHLDRVGK